MRFRKTVVKLQRSQYCCACLWYGFSLRNEGPTTHKRIGIRQPCVGTGVIRIVGDGLLKIIRRLLKTLLGSLIPEISAFKIKIVCLIGTRRGQLAICDPQLSTTAERLLYFVSSFLGDFSLKSQQALRFAIILS